MSSSADTLFLDWVSRCMARNQRVSRSLADSKIERDLSIDGVSEAAIYVAGVGTRPPDTDWAP